MAILTPDKVYYFASPYSHKSSKVITARYKEQQRLVAHLTKELGLTIINPIEMCHNMSRKYKLPSGYEFWQKRDRKFISISDGIIVAKMPGFQDSVGVRDEMNYAHSLKKYIYILEPDTLKIIGPTNLSILKYEEMYT
jgi:hypothetical protein